MTLPASRNGGNLKDACTNHSTTAIGWYTTDTFIPGSATNCGSAYTTAVPCSHKTSGQKDSSKMPWRAPGTAEVKSPCGGYCSYGTGCSLTREAAMLDGRDLPKTERTTWTAGSTAQVGFALMYNHGGGYSYRLCPAAEEQTEDCFQKLHLAFSSDSSTIHWTDGTEEEIAAVTLSSGTHPAGSQWRTIRIPACDGTELSGASYCNRELLPKPCEKCCAHECNHWDYSVVDEVAVPAGLAAGEYTLSWRWDSEINPQVWQNCADIEITGGSPSPSPRPTPSPQPTPTPSVSPSPSPSSCTYIADTMPESYTGKEDSPSKEECCSRCAQKAGCESVAFQNNKCKWADKGSPRKQATGAFLCVLGKDEVLV